MTFPCIIMISAAVGGKTYDPGAAEGEIIYCDNRARRDVVVVCGGSGRRGAGGGELAPCQAWQGTAADGLSSLALLYITPGFN